MDQLNGESSVHIDRGRWLYRFALDTDNIAIYRARRAGQGLASSEVWRCLAELGISDVFIVPVPGGWQPFVELGDGSQRWALETRASMTEAEVVTHHFLSSLADASAHASQSRGMLAEMGPEAKAVRPPSPPVPPAQAPEVETVLAQARAAREATGWELLYSRQRALR